MAMKRITTVLLLTLFLVAVNAVPGYAAFVWKVPEWSIPFIGKMRTPEGFSAVEVKDFGVMIEQEKKKLSEPKKVRKVSTELPLPELPEGVPQILTDSLPRNEASLNKRFINSELALYHLSMDDGEAVHVAWFLAVRDGDKLAPAARDLFSRELTPEQTQTLEAFKKWVGDNLHKAQYKDEKNRVELKLLEILPLQVLNTENGKIWTIGGRSMVTVENMPFAFFARIYAMNINDRLAVGILGGFDGERPFWDPVVRDIMLSLQQNSERK